MKSKEKTNQFNVYTDDGKKFEVIEYTEFLDAGDYQNPNETIPGLKSLQTKDGMKVNYDKGSDTYKIVQLGLVCRRK